MARSRSLLRYASLARWQRFLAGRIENRRRERADDRLDEMLASRGPVKFTTGEATVIADGMWFNPNHFFRLRLFAEALAGRGEGCHLLGVLRRRADARARRALERIGFTEFLYLEEDDEFRTSQFYAEASDLLAGASNHSDLLALQLPEGLPAYVWYDTVLKLASHPQPAIAHPIWRTALAEALRDLAIYRRELQRRKVVHVVLSHPWKTEWASLVWLALGRDIPVCHLTGFCEGIRIRRFRSREDYATPVEHLPHAQFEMLPKKLRSMITAIGRRDLEKRISGRTTDINARHAYVPALRISERNAARVALSGQIEKPIAIVYGHVWCDFPHSYGMANFTDFLDWTRVTLERIRQLDQVIWLLKPHPTEGWYGGFQLADVAQDLPPHVRLLPMATDNETALLAADAVVTVHGTVGLEAAARGLPVVLADRSYFSDWNMAHVARDRADYLRLLGEVARLVPPDPAARERALACFALALGEPPADSGALVMSCDTNGLALYSEIERRLSAGGKELPDEIDRIARFLKQSEFQSYAAFNLVDFARNALQAQMPRQPAFSQAQSVSTVAAG